MATLSPLFNNVEQQLLKRGNCQVLCLLPDSACDHIPDWVLGTPEGTWVSMGVYSNGSYNVPAGLIYSFPVTCHNGEWTVVQGLPIDELSKNKMDATAAELSEEKDLAYSCLS